MADQPDIRSGEGAREMERYEHTTCEACDRKVQVIDSGRHPGPYMSSHIVCGLCLRLGIGRTFDELKASRGGGIKCVV